MLWNPRRRFLLFKSQIIARSRKLSITTDFQKLIMDGYDIVYLALGKKYLVALGWGWQDDVKGTIIGFENHLGIVNQKYAVKIFKYK